jgi:NAD(P)H-hydrate epimerase
MGTVKRDPGSHKGENGKVAVIGGSATIHGAPLLSALAAEATGVDLVFVSLPHCHRGVAKNTSLNFQVHPFAGDELGHKDVAPLLELLATVDTAVIGPGLHRTTSLQPLRALIAGATCRLVLDATALQPWVLEAVTQKNAVLTPHLGELERMGLALKDIGTAAKRHQCTIHVKGTVDQIAGTHGKIRKVKGGNAGLTVGGTGDALAGIIAGLLAQGITPADACAMATTMVKQAGHLLLEECGYSYTAWQVISMVPQLLSQLSPAT